MTTETLSATIATREWTVSKYGAVIAQQPATAHEQEIEILVERKLNGWNDLTVRVAGPTGNVRAASFGWNRLDRRWAGGNEPPAWVREVYSRLCREAKARREGAIA